MAGMRAGTRSSIFIGTVRASSNISAHAGDAEHVADLVRVRSDHGDALAGGLGNSLTVSIEDSTCT